MAFLNSVMEFEDAFLAVKSAATARDADRLSASLRELRSKHESVRRAKAAVSIEGPEEVNGAAAATLAAIRGMLLELSDNPWAASSSDSIRHVITARNGFEHKAKLVLDSPEYIPSLRYPVRLRP